MTYIVLCCNLTCLDHLVFKFLNTDCLIHDWFEKVIIFFLDNQGLSS